LSSDGHTGSSNNSNDKARKTRGKPPKKCLAESPEHEPDDLKAASMKYAEAIRAQFDEPQTKLTSKKKSKTNKRKAGGPLPEDSTTSNNKTPRLVIKFSKDSSTSGGSGNVNAGANAEKIRENGGRDEYDFDEENVEVKSSSKNKPSAKLPAFVDGTMDSSSINNSPAEPKVIFLPKLKIKI
jgi:hypothetical protein